MTRNTAQATQRSSVITPSTSATTQARPRMARKAQTTSPTATPMASGQAAGNPPAIDRAISASQTGPGVRNRIRSAME